VFQWVDIFGGLPPQLCCSVWQCVAVCSDPRRFSPTCVLQCGAVCCGVLQCVAVCSDPLRSSSACVLQCITVCCSVLQCVVVHCNVPLSSEVSM